MNVLILNDKGIIEDISKLHFYTHKSLIETGDSRITEFISNQIFED